MRRREFWVTSIVAILVMFPVPAHAALCLPAVVDKDNPYDFVLSVADALSYTKQAQDRNDNAMANPKMTPFDLLLAIKQGKGDLECAQSKVAPFTSSTKETIKIGATGVADALKSLIDVKDLGAAMLTKLLDDDKVKLGSASEAAADLAVLQEKAWQQLMMGVVASTYAVVEVEPATGATGKMSRLALTRKQRDEVTGRLVTAFGPAVKEGLKVGQNRLISAAAALYQVVADPGRTLRPA